MGKSKKFIIALVATIVLFVGIVSIEKTVVKYTPMVKAVYCNKDIERHNQLSPSDFTMKDIPITSVNKDVVLSLSGISNMYAKDNLYSGEILNKKRIGTKDEVESFNLNPGERAVSLNFQNLEDCVGGTLRRDDIVDIAFTTLSTPTNPNVITKIRYNNIKIIDALDGAGRRIDKTDTTVPATTIIIAATPEIDLAITNLKQSQGKVTLLKVPDDEKSKTYNATIQNGNISK